MKTNTSQSDVRTNGVFYSTTILHQVVYVAYNSLLTNQTYLQKPLGFLIIPWPRVEVQMFNARSPALDLVDGGVPSRRRGTRDAHRFVSGATSRGPNQPEKRLLHRTVELIDGPTPSFHLMVIQVSHK
jgi:hypothetical protein